MIIRSFLDQRDSFERYGPYILALKNLERNIKQTLSYIKNFYEAYTQATSIPESELRIFMASDDVHNFAASNDEFIKAIYKLDMSNKELAMDVIEAACERYFMAEVVDKAELVLSKNKSGVLSDVQKIIDEYHSILRQPPRNKIEEYILDLDSLIDEEIIQQGAPFVNATPNDKIRGMREGQLGMIYAYTDTGKTSYGVANLCSVGQYLHNTNSVRPAVYCGNEEVVKRCTLRAIQCMTNWNSDEIARNKKHVRAILTNKGFDKIKFLDHVNTVPLVEKVLIDHNPRVMFIDQGTKVEIPGSRKEGVNLLEKVFNEYRELAKRYKCTIVCMAQGGDDCFEKKYPTLRDLYGSKSAIQGELDWAISIGVDKSDVNYANWRYFSITKNKGSKCTYACRFDSKRCQFTESTI